MLEKIRPDAIFVSHAHPDHGWGLVGGNGAPVYASAVTHELLRELPLLEPRRARRRRAGRDRPVPIDDLARGPLGALPVRRRPDRARRLHARVLGRHRRLRGPRLGALGSGLLRRRRLDPDGLSRPPPPERNADRPHDRAGPARLARPPRRRAGDLLALRQGADRDGGEGSAPGAPGARRRLPPAAPSPRPPTGWSWRSGPDGASLYFRRAGHSGGHASLPSQRTRKNSPESGPSCLARREGTFRSGRRRRRPRCRRR